MNEIEKTCENCKYDIEDVDGEHCWRCIHNAVEMFEPKENEIPIIHGKEELELHDREIRNKAIDDFTEKADEKIREFVLNHKDNLDFASGISVAWNIIDEIAQQLKDGGTDG